MPRCYRKFAAMRGKFPQLFPINFSGQRREFRGLTKCRSRESRLFRSKGKIESASSVPALGCGQRVSDIHARTHSPVERVSGERCAQRATPSRAGVRWPVNSPIMQNYSPLLEPPFSSQPCDYLRNAYHRAYRGVSRARFARTHYTPVITRALLAPIFPLPIGAKEDFAGICSAYPLCPKEKRHSVKAQPAFFTASVSRRSIDPRQCRKC